jgi:dihydrofolate synthase/folylpolyglutamate synthase
MQVKPNTVDGWLAYIEALHPKSIAMGLDRVREVANRLSLNPQCPVITVAGTNGKGSTCAMLMQIYADAGYRVGCYTSPHLIRYQERVRINHMEIPDDALCDAFLAVENARHEIELTYFEMGTLAAMWYFLNASLDLIVLEVGLGGRLDAVNIFDADCAIVTNVDLDHMEYLGHTRELIGFEKAGVYRPMQLAICGDTDPPDSLVMHAKALGVELHHINKSYHIHQVLEGANYEDDRGTIHIPMIALIGEFQWRNAASVIFAIRHLGHILSVTDDHIIQGLARVKVIGRFQYVHHQPDVIVDVAHNPHAAISLVANLKHIHQHRDGKLIAVFSMLVDKDIEAVVSLLKADIDVWHIAEIEHSRAATLQDMLFAFNRQQIHRPIYAHASIEDALRAAYKNASKNDKIIVFGSFFTVAAVLSNSQLTAFEFE